MNTVALHNPTIAAGNKKPRRYVLCLEMTQTITTDFFPAAKSNPGLFQQLGEIAYWIDTQLDDLDLQQKKALLELFPSFYDALGKYPDEITFRKKTNLLCCQLAIHPDPGACITALYRFYIYCTELGLAPELKEFSITAIRSAILKSKASNAADVLKSMQDEGAACVHFLFLLMEKENLIYPGHRKFIPLKGYLRRLEAMLNIADAIYDYRRDKKSGVLGIQVGKSLHYVLSLSFSKAFFSTIVKNHYFFFKHFLVFTGRCLRAGIF